MQDDNAADDESLATIEDYMRFANVKNWPLFVSSEKPLRGKKKPVLGSQEDIFKVLKRSTAMHCNILEVLSLRIADFDEDLRAIGHTILTPTPVSHDDKEEDDEEDAATPRQLALVEHREEEDDAIDSLRLNKQRDNPRFFSEVSTSETVHSFSKKDVDRSGSLEFCFYGGYVEGELNTLPSQVEAPQIMHRVTKAQDFTPGFKKFWIKVFQSEASIAMMIDSFWWIFIDRFNKDRFRSDKNKLFDRIAECFVHLFISINPEIKDKILKVFAECLAQSIFSAFLHCFSKSYRQFHEEFRRYVLFTISRWISGTSPPEDDHKHWNVDRLNKQSKVGSISAVASQNASHANGNTQYSLDVEDTIRCINALGTAPANQLVAAGDRNTSSSSYATQPTDLTLADNEQEVALPVAASRQALCGTPRIFPKESHVLGVGADYQRLLFRLKGHSPLVSRYMELLSLKVEFEGRQVTRTHIVHKMGPDIETYRQLINKSIHHQDSLAEQYSRICDHTKDEIRKIKLEMKKNKKPRKRNPNK